MLSVRPIQENDIDKIIEYWTKADTHFLNGMGVDTNKIPSENEWRKMLLDQISQPIEAKQSYCIIWLLDNQPIGHSNINKIIFSEEAYMHLHIWRSDIRKNGLGISFVKMTLPYYFKNFKLKKLLCEPYALNPAPNKTLQKLGFSFIKNYITTPGWLNYEQPVNRWELSCETFKKMEKEWP